MESLNHIEIAARKYAELHHIHNDFAVKLESTFRELVSVQSKSVVLIESRAKTVDSFKDKIGRPGKFYEDPLQEVTDLTGIRIVVHTTDAVESICALIREEFEIDEINCVDKAKTLKPWEFGYLSKHLVISLNSPRKDLLEYKRFCGLKAEVQVRTVLQHAWAAIDHRLRYKGSDDAPDALARRLFLLSGMFELADKEFAELDELAESHRRNVATAIARSDLSLPIDADSLASYLDSSSVAKRLEDIANSAGFLTESEIEFEDDDWTKRAISNLAVICSNAGLKDVAELEAVLLSFEPHALSYYSELISRSETLWTGARPFYCLLGVLYVNLTHLDIPMVLNGWAPSIADRVVQAAKHLKAKARSSRKPRSSRL